jgi:hypothetical protein
LVDRITPATVGVAVGVRVGVRVGGSLVSDGIGVIEGVYVALGIGVAVKRGVKDTIGPSVRVGRRSTLSSSLVEGDGVLVGTSSHAAVTRTRHTSNPMLQRKPLRIQHYLHRKHNIAGLGSA